jgi:hypothetical protein
VEDKVFGKGKKYRPFSWRRRDRGMRLIKEQMYMRKNKNFIKEQMNRSFPAERSRSIGEGEGGWGL